MKPRLINPLRYLMVAAVTAMMIMTARAEPPVKVYILAGQSNMQGKGGY